jgi:hypothetical protein
MTIQSTESPSGEKRRASRDRLLADLTVVEPTPSQRRRAALAVCHFNPDPAQAREMLDALGLLGRGELGGDELRHDLLVAS